MSEEKKVKPPKMVKVKVIETRGESSLVEWLDKGTLRRGYVQNGSMHDGKAMATVLALALPVGPNPEKINLRLFTKQLRLHGVWTKADFRHKYKSVIRCLYEAMPDGGK